MVDWEWKWEQKWGELRAVDIIHDFIIKQYYNRKALDWLILDSIYMISQIISYRIQINMTDSSSEDISDQEEILEIKAPEEMTVWPVIFCIET